MASTIILYVKGNRVYNLFPVKMKHKT